jgi:hypothetical protein
VTRFRLRFPLRDIPKWAAVSEEPDDPDLEAIATRARKSGYVARRDLLRLARWKTPRSRPRVESNSAATVRSVTRRALASEDERSRIELLTRLRGIGWPTASVVLHFCHADPYPILDVRSLWSFGIERPPAYRFEFWWQYTLACRRAAARAGCSMRNLDRAAWQFSVERQAARPPRKRSRRRRSRLSGAAGRRAFSVGSGNRSRPGRGFSAAPTRGR